MDESKKKANKLKTLQGELDDSFRNNCSHNNNAYLTKLKIQLMNSKQFLPTRSIHYKCALTMRKQKPSVHIDAVSESEKSNWLTKASVNITDIGIHHRMPNS